MRLFEVLLVSDYCLIHPRVPSIKLPGHPGAGTPRMTRTFAAPQAGRVVKGLRVPKGMHTRRHMATLGFKAAAPDSTSPSNPLTTHTSKKIPHATPTRSSARPIHISSSTP